MSSWMTRDAALIRIISGTAARSSEKLIEVLQKVSAKYNQPAMALAVSGSAAMGLQEKCSLPFVQEVYATRIAATKRLEEVDCIIELGGEDAKILFLSGRSGSPDEWAPALAAPERLSTRWPRF